jgi:hypothetical protein
LELISSNAVDVPVITACDLKRLDVCGAGRVKQIIKVTSRPSHLVEYLHTPRDHDMPLKNDDGSAVAATNNPGNDLGVGEIARVPLGVSTPREDLLDTVCGADDKDRSFRRSGATIEAPPSKRRVDSERHERSLPSSDAE